MTFIHHSMTTLARTLSVRKASYLQDFDTNFSIATMSDVQPIQTFEPQADMSAIFSFLVVSTLFSLLQIRINAIGNAARKREEALNTLRQVKMAQLDLSTSALKPTEQDVKAATEAYEYALDQELSLRTVIPGVRIVAPNDPKQKEEEISAARQFLGRELDSNEYSTKENTDQSSSYDSKKSLLLKSRRRFDEKNDIITDPSTSMSVGSNVVLLGVSLVLIGLLFILSFDPVTGENFFTWLDSHL